MTITRIINLINELECQAGRKARYVVTTPKIHRILYDLIGDVMPFPSQYDGRKPFYINGVPVRRQWDCPKGQIIIC